MRIKSLLPGKSDSMSLTSLLKSEATSPAAAARKQQTQAAATEGAGRSALAKILSRFDVQQITPSEFSELVQKLTQAGAITQEEAQQLAGIRIDLDAAGVKSDEKVNLSEFYSKRIAQLERQAADHTDAQLTEQLAAARKKLDWVQKFALVQANPDAAGKSQLV